MGVRRVKTPNCTMLGDLNAEMLCGVWWFFASSQKMGQNVSVDVVAKDYASRVPFVSSCSRDCVLLGVWAVFVGKIGLSC